MLCDSGSLDPGVVLYLLQERGMRPEDVTRLLYQESGLLGLSGISGDMFLGCLLSVGWPVEALRQAITDLAWEQPFDHQSWSVTHRNVMKGPFHATLAEVTVTEAGQPHRHLSDIRELLEKSRSKTVRIDSLRSIPILGQRDRIPPAPLLTPFAPRFKRGSRPRLTPK